MSDDQLLAQLQGQGLLDDAAVNRVKREALISDSTAESIIWKQRLADDKAVAQLKSATMRVPLKGVDPATIDEKLLSLIPEDTARTYATIPLSFANDLLVVGMLNPDDPKAQEAIKFVARQNHWNLGVYLISYGDWQDILKKYSPFRNEIEKAVQSIGEKGGDDPQKIISLDTIDSDQDAPVIRIVADTFREAVQRKASDVHVEPQQKSLRIRFRIDGDLQQVASLPIELAQPITSRIKVISNLKIDETRIPQDGRFRSRIRLPRCDISYASRREDCDPRARSAKRPEEFRQPAFPIPK